MRGCNEELPNVAYMAWMHMLREVLCHRLTSCSSTVFVLALVVAGWYEAVCHRKLDIILVAEWSNC